MPGLGDFRTLMRNPLVTWLASLLALSSLAATAFAALPWLVRPILKFLLWPRYRLVVRGLSNVPETGPALLAANHVTWIDGFLVTAVCPRPAKFLVNAGIIDKPIVRQLARRVGLIPVPFSGPRAQRAALEECQVALDRGDVVVLFPEAQLTRNGLLGAFYRGIEVILTDRAQVPVIPLALDNLWGSLYSYSGGRFLRKWPIGLRRQVGIVFGVPVRGKTGVFEIRQALLETLVHAFEIRERPAIRVLETIDPELPHLDHPGLGPLTGSTPDFERDGVRQTGIKPGSLGQALPGVAIRVVDSEGGILPAEIQGRLQALRAGQAKWEETGLQASIDRDGFVRIVNATQ